VRYTKTFALPSISGKTVGTNNQLLFELWTSAGSAFNSRAASIGIQTATIDFWGIQIEAGSVATPFTTASGTIGGELALCQRYYYRIAASKTYQSMGIGSAFSTTQAAILVNNPVTMRIVPTSIDFSLLRLTDTTSDIGVTALTIDSTGSSFNVVSVIATVASGLTQFRPVILSGGGNASNFLGFSAEL
jgi:hypothetical protein